MKYRFLGQTGIKVSSLCLGTMTFGGEADEVAAAEMFNLAREYGINFFDCANIYNQGRAEEILGQLIQSCREEVIITSKAYFPTGEDPNARGASRRHLFRSVEASLKRLRTDWIDIFFIHRFDDFTSLEETLRALDDLVHQGKILYIGASNFAAWQVEKALGISQKEGLASFVCIQPMYNLVKRQAEVEIFPMAQAEKLGVVAYSPLGGGLLTGKYHGDNPPEQGRLLTNKIYGTRYGEKWMHEVAQRFVVLAKEKGYNPVSLAVAWVNSHPAVTAAIVGARNAAQLKASLDSIKIEMTPELRATISALSPEPPPATDRTEERSPYTLDNR
ncbi:MAG: aldo/keto reductase [Candidatus Aminicenantes bacterium]|nr:aldo/keto reductase [Candidatus Aminicenantes bacterium]